MAIATNYTVSCKNCLNTRNIFDNSLLSRTDPVEIVIAPSDVYVTEGDTVLLTCVAIGPPVLEITWYVPGPDTYIGNGTYNDVISVHQSSIVQNDILFVTSILEICGIEFENSGEFSCAAYSSDVPDYVSAQFNVTVEDQEGTVLYYTLTVHTYVALSEEVDLF